MELVVVAVAAVALNLAALALGYYVGLGHIDRMLDIEEGERDAEFPPGFGGGGRERVGPLSPEEIDEVDDWDRWK
jgi:hypothetical protein